MDSTLPNKHARLSLLSALLTVIFFCVGFAPFLPLTAFVCYPAALVSSVTALVSGLRGLRHPSGRWMAWAGIVIGTLTILAVIFFTTLTALFIPVFADWLKEFWQTIHP